MLNTDETKLSVQQQSVTPTETVTLTFEQIEYIIRWELGWDDIDVDNFWDQALKHQERSAA